MTSAYASSNDCCCLATSESADNGFLKHYKPDERICAKLVSVWSIRCNGLTDAYLANVLSLDEYKQRRQEIEQRQQGIAEQVRQLEASVGRHDQLAGIVQSIEAFCQRVQQGLAEATFEQKRQLIELLIDRIVVTEEEVEIRYVIPTSAHSEHSRFCHLRLDYFNTIVDNAIVVSTGPRDKAKAKAAKAKARIPAA